MRIPPHLRKKFIMEAIENGMRLLTFDIETSHAILRSFQMGGKTYINHHQIKVPSKVITIQYKWAHEKTAKYFKWRRISNKYDDARNFDDSEMIEKFEKTVLSKADVLHVQNGDKFDSPTLNERAKAMQLCIMSQKPSMDILKLSRKSFRSASNKLDYRSDQQGLGGKIKMMDDDWVDIEERNVPVTVKMVPYGLKDVTDTETLGLEKELPYYKDLPAAVEKVVLSFLKFERVVPRAKAELPKCPSCRKRHRLATDVKKRRDGKHKCNQCKEVF